MEINYPSGKDHWKKFEKNDPPIALNVLYVRIKKKYISCLYFKIQHTSRKSNHSFNDSKWRRKALSFSKKLDALSR